MALESKRENNVVMKLASECRLPRMVKVKQLLDPSHLDKDVIPSVVKAELENAGTRERIKKDARIAITCGSRGVANIAIIIKAIVDFVKDCGGKPFVFPSMGSHGGATAEGQRLILTGYGVTEENMGCPILSSMDTVFLGRTPEGRPVYCDRNAYEADGIILCGRVKAHTAFRGPFESGILKMAVIGMGKQKGAEACHVDGFLEMGRIVQEVGKVVLDSTNIVSAVGLVENAFDQTCLISAMKKEDVWTREPELLKEAKKRMGKLFFDNIDVLVVDKIGKDVSGDGMDPNVTGRFAVPHVKGDLKVQHIAVLDLTEETHGNSNGIGLADVTTKRLVDKIDSDCTFPNVCTSTVLCTPKVPLFTHSDESCVQIALRTCNYIDRKNPRVVRIEDTMHLQEIWISEPMLEEAEANKEIEVLSEPFDWPFDKDGNLF